MNSQRLAGIVISAGFVLYVIAMFVAPRLYQTDDITNRLTIIATNETRWNVSRFFFALGIRAPTFGFLLLTSSQQAAQSAWLYYLGAAAFGAGSIIGIWLVYRQTLDPAAFWEDTQIPLIIGYGYLLLILIGLLCYGLAILQGSFLNWLGYLMAGSAAILLIAALVLRGSGGFFISVLTYLVICVVVLSSGGNNSSSYQYSSRGAAGADS